MSISPVGLNGFLPFNDSTHMTNNSNVLIPFGDWVNVGTGPGTLRMLTAYNQLRVACSATGPTESGFDETVSVYLIKKDQSVEVPEGLDAWVQPVGTSDNGNPVYVRLDPPVAVPEEEEDEIDPNDTPVLTPGAYASGKVMGGVLRFIGSLEGPSGLLRSILLRSKSVQTSDFTLYLFSSNPSASTFTDGADPVLDPSDINKLIGAFTLTEPDSTLGVSLYQLADINQAVSSPTSSLFGVLLAGGAATFVAADDVSVALGVEQA